MSKPKNIKPFNAKGQAHGYWKVYFTNGTLAYKGLFVNDKQIGVWIDHFYGSENKLFYI
jgi:antitoxin component YwqK of YwqJK toxin-antitoxin module